MVQKKEASVRRLPLATVFTVVFLLVMCSCRPCRAAGDTASRVAQERERAAEARDALQTLTAKERKVHQDLAAAEQRVRDMQRRIVQAEERLAALEAEQQDVARRLGVLDAEKRTSLKELGTLLRELWPVQIRRDVLRGRAIPDWQQADREFVWMRSVYARVQNALREVGDKERAVNKTLMEKQALAEQARERLETINKDKDALLGEQLLFRKELAAVRSQKVGQEEELKAIMALLDKLNYKLQQRPPTEDAAPSTPKLPFEKLRGKLPWPVQGKVVKGFQPNAQNPSRGLGISLAAEGTPVNAVSWGRVVHNEVLRGFGRVVILLHGDDYYSLYAYLAESDVKKGQEVKQGQVVGRAGYYPMVKGPGVYFELRFHQKAINPRKWLIVQK